MAYRSQTISIGTMGYLHKVGQEAAYPLRGVVVTEAITGQINKTN